MTFWGICLRAELEAQPNVWPIAKDFATEQAALNATSVSVRVKRVEAKSDYAGTALTGWRDYWIDGNGQEPGKVYRFDSTTLMALAAGPKAHKSGKESKPTSKPKSKPKSKAKPKAMKKPGPGKGKPKKGAK